MNTYQTRRSEPQPESSPSTLYPLVDGSVTKPGELPLGMAYWVTIRPGSRPAMLHALRAVGRVAGYEDWRQIPWHAMTPAVVSQIMQGVEAAGYGGSTLRRVSVAIRKILKMAKRRRIYTDQEAEEIGEAANQYPRPVWQPAAGRRLTLEECRQQIQGAPGEMERLILMLGMIYGLRRGEMSELSRGDLDPITGNLRVMGKGRKVRAVPLAGGMVRELQEWLAGHPHEAMFPTAAGRHHNTDQIRKMLHRARLAAGVAPWKPHDLRRTAVTQLLEAGHDPILVARAMGHSRVETTMVYDRRGPEATRAAFAGVGETVGGKVEERDG